MIDIDSIEAREEYLFIITIIIHDKIKKIPKM